VRDCASHVVVAFVAGVLILDWETEILPKIQKVQKKRSNEINLLQHTVRRQFKPYPSAWEPFVEVNDVVVQGNYVFGAAGAAFGCYKWDLETEKVVTTYKPTRGGYLHTVDRVPDDSNLLLTGGEDGILGIWDTATDKRVDSIDVNEAVTSSITGISQPPHQKRRTAVSGSESSRWISSCKARDESWWTVAGGYNNTGGFVSTWHGPTRSLVSTVETQETPQQLAFYDNDNSTTLLSVANESYVSHWKNPLSLCEDDGEPRRQRVWCNQPSAYAVTVSQDGRRIATGGVGSVVDIFEQGTQYGMQLSTH
jgi:WD40 repeat protein